jgi:hypothetical protein
MNMDVLHAPKGQFQHLVCSTLCRAVSLELVPSLDRNEWCNCPAQMNVTSLSINRPVQSVIVSLLNAMEGDCIVTGPSHPVKETEDSSSGGLDGRD